MTAQDTRLAEVEAMIAQLSKLLADIPETPTAYDAQVQEYLSAAYSELVKCSDYMHLTQ